MKLWSKWIWAAIFCLSTVVCANEADALRVDKVYKVLFVNSIIAPPPGYGLLPEVQVIHDLVEDVLPPSNGSMVVERTPATISGMSGTARFLWTPEICGIVPPGGPDVQEKTA